MWCRAASRKSALSKTRKHKVGRGNLLESLVQIRQACATYHQLEASYAPLPPTHIHIQVEEVTQCDIIRKGEPWGLLGHPFYYSSLGRSHPNLQISSPWKHVRLGVHSRYKLQQTVTTKYHTLGSLNRRNAFLYSSTG